MTRQSSWPFLPLALSTLATLLTAAPGHTAIVRITEANFTAQAGKITFSEQPVGTINPHYVPGDYGGSATAPSVDFAGFFTGQTLGTAATCPTGAAVTGCVNGLPTGTLSLDGNSPSTSIVTDTSNPTSPVLSGSPTFNGPISVLFSVDQVGVGLDGGFFDAIGGTAITAFSRDGSVLGSVMNTQQGIEFLGLATDDGVARIAGLQFSLVGDEPSGFGIDNLRFGSAGQVIVPEPEAVIFILLGFAPLLLFRTARRG